MSQSVNPPEGFEPVPAGLGYTDSLQPLYRRIDDDLVSFGLSVAEQHLNVMGLCHGGVLMTLADVAAASGVNHAMGTKGGTPTINLSFDFVNGAKAGQWLQADVTSVTMKRRFGFASGVITHGELIIARFNGTFYVPDHDGIWKRGKAAGALARK
ncbi:PaaI family thioesterase [Parahaliea sp. F7430]|uniref:PaaI family thioesterase n=1 Tax=Sediminihaliea albiluteola TaxID=2758564 RepID=A0A7W2TU94_9GAMM|nr:PaaI family thioesterase [Sediminihaliea albiluteola]MBA6412031.1 PaaI family thioesterase [Sediminihaliea albiluteola]